MLAKHELSGWRLKAHEIIYEADTFSGKLFDILLIFSIALSTVIVMLESVSSVRSDYGSYLRIGEWIITILFTIEYILRIVCVGKPIRYIISYYGIIDLLSILPTYISLLIPGTQYLVVIRALRILRVFRVLKLAKYLKEAELLVRAVRASSKKITVFLFAVITLVSILGSLMYLVEGEASGFTSIPRSIYWAIVTLTTVGYGDITPQTNLGQFIAAWIMILGYGIIAVPTGIVSVQVAGSVSSKISTQACPECSHEGHDSGAKYCKYCGAKL